MRKKCVMLSNYVVKDRDAGAKAPKDVTQYLNKILEKYTCYIILIVDILEIFCRG